MRRQIGAPLTAGMLVAVLALVGCGGGGDGDKKAKPPPGGGPHAGEGAVRIANFEFKPQNVVVKPGTKVTWTNADSSIHDIKDTSPLATPVSPSMSKGDTFSITYGQPGTYSYVCGIHPYMIGSVEVVP
jgi:plastocyanin